MRPQLIVALDVPNMSLAKEAVSKLPQEVAWYKVGLELFIAEGPQIVTMLKDLKKKVFLDLKLHDIPNTVAKSVASASRLGADMMTVHASGSRSMLEAAARSAADFGPTRPQLVAVTALTSLNAKDLNDLGVTQGLKEYALRLGSMALECGIDGVVCSVHEALDFRKSLGSSATIVTPGIRPAGSDLCDQKRVATPEMAVKSGSNYLVVGRPVLSSPCPSEAAKSILVEIANSR